MELITSTFGQLTTVQLYEIYKLRSLVFVVEQNCAYQDVDEKDLKALHFMMWENEQLIGYCRILPPGVSYPHSSIGRVVVSKDARGKGSGRLLMNQCIHKTRELFNNQDIVISAQTYLMSFYSGLGFIAEGEEYSEDDIPHIKMRLKPNH